MCSEALDSEPSRLSQISQEGVEWGGVARRNESISLLVEAEPFVVWHYDKLIDRLGKGEWCLASMRVEKKRGSRLGGCVLPLMLASSFQS